MRSTPPQSTIEPTQASVRPRWYRLYFLLALLDIVTVSISMGLNVQLMNSYSASVELNQAWSARQEDYATLAALATEVNAPGNEVFDGLDIAVAKGQVLRSLEQFNASLAAARNDIVKLASAESAPLLATFTSINAAMTEMHDIEMNIFDYFEAGEAVQAGERMATMDRIFGRLNATIAHLSAQVRTIQSERFSEQLRSAQEMRRVEYGIFLLVILMVVGALYYGRRIVTEIKKSTIEQERKGDEILRLNASLEEQLQQLHSHQEELRQSTDQLRDSEAILSATVNTALDAVVQMDVAGIITLWNTRAEEIFGWKSEEATGRMLYETIIPPQYREAHIRGIKHFLATGEGPVLNKRIEIFALHRDGHEFPIELSIAPHKMAGQYWFSSFIRDITERKRAQEELRQSYEELAEKNKLLEEQKVEVEYKNREIEDSKLTLEEKAKQLALTSKYKSEFLSNMSHELRTPLNSLLILAQLLAENDGRNMSGKQIEYAKIIQGSGKDLLALINDILDLSKIESGIVTLELEDVLFANVREQTELAFRHVVDSRRGLGFGVELAQGLPPSLYTDSQRLQQVLKNLLSNAFKFTEKGQVSVRIAAVESGWSVAHDGLNRAQTVIGFYVTDTGIGLPADKQKIIFEAFQQADTGTAKKYGGTGLGLSISREIAWMLGGELHLVESSPGKGSTFALYLPLRTPESWQGITPKTTQRTPAAQKGAQETNPQPPAVADDRATIKPKEPLLIVEDAAGFADSLADKKVLVVDDSVRNLFALTALLEHHKMVVTSTENGRDALDALGKNPDVDIVLMDIMMPEMDGYETMRQVRQMKQFESLPMIALTAKAMQGDREKCIEAGASDYISKPVDTDQLLSLLRVWLYR